MILDKVDDKLAAEQAEMRSGDSATDPALPDSLYDPWTEYDAPPFPLDVLPDGLARFIEAKAKETGACLSACAMSVLAVCSAATTHEAILYLKPGRNFPVRPNIWVLLYCAVSSRKSPAMLGAVQPYLETYHERVAAHIESERLREERAKAGEEDFEPKLTPPIPHPLD
jgi:hypothetical protein